MRKQLIPQTGSRVERDGGSKSRGCCTEGKSSVSVGC